MDYTKLTDQEIIDVLRYHNLISVHFLPQNWMRLIESIPIVPGTTVAVELIDLYIATSLFQENVTVPSDLNLNLITAEYYHEVAPMLYLPRNFSTDNLQRAKQIIRIIQSYQSTRIQSNTGQSNRIQVMPVIYSGNNRVGDYSSTF